MAVFVTSSQEALGEFEEELGEPLVIFAASSTASTLERIFDVTSDFPKPKIVIGPSGTLARQIAAGAPADIYISANKDWIDYLENERALKSEPQSLIANRLVFAAHEGHEISRILFEASSHMLLYAPRIAVADPKIAPLGRYSVDYLSNLGIWNKLRNKAAYGQSARQTFRLVETAGLPGFVYKSDAVQSNKVTIILELGPKDDVSIIYQAAITTQSDHKEAAQAAIDYLLSHDAAKIWQAQGFSLLSINGNE